MAKVRTVNTGNLCPQRTFDQMEFSCHNPKVAFVECTRFHWHKIFIRCRKYDTCSLCKDFRIKSILAKAYSRYNSLEHKPKFIALWTFGTSLVNSKENQLIALGKWKKFLHKMRNYYSRHHKVFHINMWVMESGSKGNRIHFHALVFGFASHEYLIHHWRKTTGEKSNVNYTIRQRNNPKHAFRYVAKYLSKQGSKYYWAGSLLTSASNLRAPFNCWICMEGFGRIIFIPRNHVMFNLNVVYNATLTQWNLE